MIKSHISVGRYISENQEILILSLERWLGIKFPKSYREFLLRNKNRAVIDGFPVLGLPISYDPNKSVLGATILLRKQRPDLSEFLITICLHGTHALCLKLGNNSKEDAPLVEVALKSHTQPKPLGQTFKEWVKLHERYEKRFREAYQRVVERRKETEEWRGRKFSHLKDGLIPRPEDWRPIVSRVQDYIVGLTALRYNPRYNCLEVDEFYAFDHPDYESGEAIRNLTKLMFVMARDFGGSLDIIFTQERWDKKPTFFRPSRPIPKELVALAKDYEITFKQEEQGKISHGEGVKFSFSLLEFPPEVQARIEDLEKAGYLTKEMITEVVHTGIWSREEAVWLFLNAPRPEAILLGSALADNRPYHAEAMNYARSVLLVVRLKQVIMVQMRNGFSPEEKSGVEITAEPKGKFWVLKGDERFYLPSSWTIDKSEIRVEAKEPVLLLSRPRLIARPEYNKAWLREDIELLLHLETETKKRCLLINYEFISPDYNSDVEGIKEIVREATQKGVCVLFPPARTSLLLDDEIENRMRRARAMKVFPLREGPLKLWVFEIPSYEWDIPSGVAGITRDAVALRNASRDAIVFAGYIFNKVDIHRCRRQFAFNCEVVERVALCYPKSKKIAEFYGKENEELIADLKGKNKYKNITFSYVRPSEIPEFVTKITGRIKKSLEKTQGGIVVVVAPYESVELPMVKVEIPEKEAPLPIKLPAAITDKIALKIKQEVDKKEYISREVEIKSAHRQLQKTIKNHLPLSVSSIQPQVFVEVIREYLNYSIYFEERKEKFLWIFSRRKKYKRREPSEPVELRIAYSDGTEGRPFPLFCLAEGLQRPQNLFELHASLVSLRHMTIDYYADVSLIRNMEIQDRENSAEQEDFAFREVCFFLENFIKLLRHEVNVKEISQTEKISLYLWNKYNLTKKREEGLELHLYQGTGLEPAVVGAYRAVVEILKRYRGQLVVVPRIFSRDKETQKVIYSKAKEWW